MIAGLLTGCSGDPRPGGDPDATQAPASTDTVRLALVVKNIGNPFFDAVHKGWEEACEELMEGCRTLAELSGIEALTVGLREEEYDREPNDREGNISGPACAYPAVGCRIGSWPIPSRVAEQIFSEKQDSRD